MKYFLTEAQRKASGGSCYLEFQRGEEYSDCWLEDSLCLHDDLFNELDLYELFIQAIPHFAYYGITVVTPKAWEELVKLAQQMGAEKTAVIAELVPWVAENFKTEKTFKIMGI